MSSLAQQLFDEGLEKGLAIAVYALMQHQNCTQDAAMNILDIQPQDRQAIAALLAEKQSTL